MSTIFESNSVLKAAHAKGSGGMPSKKLFHLRWHSRPFRANVQYIVNVYLNISYYVYLAIIADYVS